MGASNKHCPDHLPGPRQRKTGPGILLLLVSKIINTYTFLQGRGTPGSGKTTLLKLLRNLILKEEEGATVHVISYWFPKTNTRPDLTPGCLVFSTNCMKKSRRPSFCLTMVKTRTGMGNFFEGSPTTSQWLSHYLVQHLRESNQTSSELSTRYSPYCAASCAHLFAASKSP